MSNKERKTAHYHLPGLFEFYELYSLFLPLFYEHREYFYEWCDIGSVYGAPADCLWGGGRVGYGDNSPEDVYALMNRFPISARLTFSNSLIKEEHLSDKKCNELCDLFQNNAIISANHSHGGEKEKVRNGIILYSDTLLSYLKEKYPDFYFVSSTTKVLTNFEELRAEIDRDDFDYVVPDFRLNIKQKEFSELPQEKKDKVEFLCNECCSFGCTERKRCYESVSRKALGLPDMEHRCGSTNAYEGYVFSKAMENPAFISIDNILHTYLPMGFSNFKIEGRSLGSALVLEFLLYYMTKPEHQLRVREKIYLSHSLDLF